MEQFDEMLLHLEEVYGNAYWAFRCGATRESVLGEIDEAFETHQQQLEDDRLAGRNKPA